MRNEVRGKLGFRVATAVVAGLLISSEGDAVMLEWMGKKKVVNHHNEVPFHVLERKWELSHGERVERGEEVICTLGAAELEKYHITFKKIPRDIIRF